MATYTNLAGGGAQGLSSNVSRLYVDVVTFGKVQSTGRASPTNYFHLGLLRLGVQGAYYPVIPIDAASMVIDVPPGVTTLGYSLQDVTTISVTEVIGPLSHSALMPWDRNPLAIADSFSAFVPGGTADTVAYTYTVPANRLFMLAYSTTEVDKYLAPTTTNYQYIYNTINGTPMGVKYLNSANGGPSENESHGGFGVILRAGGVITCHYSNLDAGGSVAMSAAFGGTEFDA